MLKEANEQREAAENLVTIKQFALEAQQQITKSIVNNKDIIIEMKNELIEQKDTIDAVQQEKIAALTTINEQLKTIDAKEDVIDKLEGAIGVKENVIGELEEVVQDKAVTIKKKDKIHQVWVGSHGITMMRTNNPTSKMPYYAIRRKQKTMSKVIKKFRIKNPCSIMVYQNSHVPNPINMYNRLKRSPIIKFKGNYCNCTAGEAALIEELKRVFTIIE